MFSKKLPSMYIKNFDLSFDLCSDYNKKTDSAKKNSIKMSVKVTDGTKIVPINISTSLECSSKNYKD